MGFRSNINPQIRGFWFAPSGNDDFSGETSEVAKLTPQAAIDAAMALSPPPGPLDPAQVTASQGGIVTAGFDLPSSVSMDAQGISFIEDSAIAINLGSFLSCDVTTIRNQQDSGIAVNINSQNSTGFTSKFLGTDGANSIGINIAGSCDNIFITSSQFRLAGDGAIGIRYTGTSPSPVDLNANTVAMESDNTTFLDWNPVSSTDSGTIDVSTVTDGGVGTTAFLVQNGELSGFVSEIIAETAINVKAGATFEVTGNHFIGDIIVDAGGILNCYIQRHDGTVTNNGTINGFINGDRYGKGNSESTSFTSGGVITQGALNTQIDISAGSGTIYDYTDPDNVGVFPVAWDAFVDVDMTELAELFSFIAIDRTGAVQQFAPDTFQFIGRRDFIVLGTVTHTTGIFQESNTNYIAARETHAQFLDLLDCLGVINCTGFVVQPNADLTFDKTAGILMSPGAGNVQGNRAENAATILAESPTTFSRTLGITGTTVAAGQTDIDPANYDDGSGSAVSVPGGPNVSTIQYIFQFPVDGAVFVQYGQTVYSDLAEAVAQASADNPIIPLFIRQDALLVARIAMENGATDLSDTNEVEFLPGAKFGVDITGGSGGSGAGGGDVFGPASSTTDEIPVFADATGKILNDSSDVTLSAGDFQRITANGDMNFLRNGLGKVQFGAGSIIGDFGASELVGATVFSVASPLGFDAQIHYEHNGALSGFSGYRFLDDTTVLLDSGNLKGIHIETNGQISLADRIDEPAFSVIIGSFTDPFGLPQLTTASEASVTGQPRMIHYNSILESIRYWNQLDSEFQSLMSAPASAQVGEIPTFAITNGHRLEANSDVSVIAGAIKRLTTNANLILEQNGTGVLRLGNSIEIDGQTITTFASDELFLGQPTVQAYLNQVQIDARSHVGGEFLFNTDTDRIQQYTESPSAGFAVHNVGVGDGDVEGPNSSTANAIATYSDTTGKVIKNASDIRAATGVLRRITANEDLILEHNGSGKVQFGDGSLLGRFGVANTGASASFSIASPTGQSADLRIENNGLIRAQIGLNSLGDHLRYVDVNVLKGLTIESDGQVSLGQSEVKSEFSVIVGGDGKPFGLPEVSNAQEGALTGESRMLSYNSDLNHVRYHNGSEFLSLTTKTAELHAYGDSGSDVTTMTSGSYVDMELPALNIINSSEFSPVADGVQYNGTGFTGDFELIYSVRTANTVTNASFDMRAFNGGTPISNFFVHKLSSASGAPSGLDLGSTLFAGSITLATNDIIKLRCKGSITNSTLTLTDIRIKAKSFL